jgi:multidrug efflux pump subunit AcrA (membrane-fusion protein)
MRGKGMTSGFVLVLLGANSAWTQTLPTSARIETVPIELTMPERYQVSEVLEPIRRITIVAPSDGVIQSLGARLGSVVRSTQDLVQLDRSEPAARLKAAEADVKEKQALVGTDPKLAAVHKAQLEAAQARAELAQLAVDRCMLRAPFPGIVVDLAVSEGQFVLKGTTLLELADVSSLKAFQPVDRRTVSAGSSLTVQIEDKEVAGKVQAIVPLPDEYLILRELGTPLAGAWVVLPNPKGELEVGLRVRTSGIPTTPVAVIPKRSLKQDNPKSAEGAAVQVIRNEFDNNLPVQIVTNLPVQVLGDVGPDRVQVTGRFRPTDSLVVASSSPLLGGTLVKFPEGAAARGSDATFSGASGAGTDNGHGQPGLGSGRGSPPRTRTVGGASNSSSRRPRSQPNPPGRQSGDGGAPF